MSEFIEPNYKSGLYKLLKSLSNHYGGVFLTPSEALAIVAKGGLLSSYYLKHAKENLKLGRSNPSYFFFENYEELCNKFLKGQIIDIKLSFSSDPNSPASRFALFPTSELKVQYVDSEYRDLSCQYAYQAYQSSWGKEERTKAKEKLDLVRWSFYKKWATKNLEQTNEQQSFPEDFPA